MKKKQWAVMIYEYDPEAEEGAELDERVKVFYDQDQVSLPRLKQLLVLADVPMPKLRRRRVKLTSEAGAPGKATS